MKTLKHIEVDEVYNLFITDCVTVPEKSMVYEAIEELLKVPTATAVYVLNEKNNVVGMILLRDLIRIASARHGIRAKGMKGWYHYMKDMFKNNEVEEIMRHPLVVKLNDTLDKALKIMEDYSLNELPVVDGKGAIVGEINGIEILNFCVETVKKGDLSESKIEKEWREMQEKKKAREAKKKAGEKKQ